MSFLSNSMTNISDGFSALTKSLGAAYDAVSTIGKGLAEFAHGIKPVLGPILATVGHLVPHPAVKVVTNIANTLLHTLSVFHTDQSVSDMGDRALQAAEQGITTDKFENFNEYMAALRDFNLSPESSSKYGEAAKLIAGLGVGTAGIADKFDLEIKDIKDLWLLPAVNSEFFTVERLKGLLEGGKTIGDLSAYLEKRMSGEETSIFRKNLEITPEGKPMNEAEQGQLYDALDSARTNWAEMKQKIEGSN